MPRPVKRQSRDQPRNPKAFECQTLDRPRKRGNSTLTIRDKVDGERTIPLTPYVAALLRDLQQRNVRPLRSPANEKWEPSRWVFASRTAESGRFQEPRIPHNRALRVAGIQGLTLHGLRRSFGTLSEWLEVPAGIVAQIQGHKPSATAEKHYRARPLDLLRAWHTRIEASILDWAQIQFDEDQPVWRLRMIG